MVQTKTYSITLAVAGSDSGGCAGIQADLKAISACGSFAATAITSLTVQNTLGVRAVHVAPVDIVAGQIAAVMEDMGVGAVKIGMLPTVEIVQAVAAELKRLCARNIVLDPVMVATSGDKLVPGDAADAVVRLLAPMAALVTPNVPEAEYITGLKITSEADFPAAAARFAALGVQNLLLKAGHLRGGETLTDHLYTGLQTGNAAVRKFEYDYIDTPNTHGTGCTLSSAAAAFLAQGHPVAEAVALAEEYLHKALLCGADYRLGHGHGPLHHFYRFWQ